MKEAEGTPRPPHPATDLPLPPLVLRHFPFLRERRWWMRLFLLWVLAVFTLSSIPSQDLPQPPGGIPWDKVVHFIEYGAGAVLLVGAGFAVRRGRVRQAVATLALLALVAGLDEWYQTLTPGRSGLDFGDWVADCVGAVLAIGFCQYLAARKRH